MRVHFSGRAFDYQTLRAMAYTTFGGAEPGEVLTTVERIDDGDTEAWHAEWRRTAGRVERLASEARRDGRTRSARAAFRRAHTYYRTAEFFLAADDPRRRPTYERARETFRSGVDLLDIPRRRSRFRTKGRRCRATSSGRRRTSDRQGKEAARPARRSSASAASTPSRRNCTSSVASPKPSREATTSSASRGPDRGRRCDTTG